MSSKHDVLLLISKADEVEDFERSIKRVMPRFSVGVCRISECKTSIDVAVLISLG